MHIIVFGLGAIGGFYGTKLASYIQTKKPKNLKISFVARGKTLDVLKHQGSKLICKKENFGEMQETILLAGNINITDSYSKLNLDPNELNIVLLCTKSKDTIPVAMAIKRNFNHNTLVVSVQNGVDNEEKIASILGIDCVIGCLTNVAAETLEPGVFMQKGSYGLVIGELEANLGKKHRDKERIKILEQVFSEAGIRVKTTETIKKDQWSKLVWNASFNPTSVLYEKTVGELLADPKIKKRIIAVMSETVAVAKAQGIDLTDDVAEKHIERTSSLDWYDFRTSMLQDFQNNKAIELNELLGIVVKRAEQFSVEAPEARKLFEDLQAKLASNVVANS